MKSLLTLILCLVALHSTFAQTSQWTWLDGDNRVPSIPNYGPIGVSGPDYKPGNRVATAQWKDQAGNIWIFGGNGTGNNGTGLLGDLWKYTPSVDQWSYMGGTTVINQTGRYGTRGVAAATNQPPSRAEATTWIDSSGQLWLYGGICIHEIPGAMLGDLWKYSPTTGMWTWVGGDDRPWQDPVYGTQGVPSEKVKPGGKYGCSSWTDQSGNFWLFGGYGQCTGPEDRISVEKVQNDLWKYNPASGMWTWISGKSYGFNTGSYGTKGVTSPTNIPPSREYAAAFREGKNLWLYGGMSTSLHSYGDLWKFDTEILQWTWMGGDILQNTAAVYGSKGIAGPMNQPGARRTAMAWSDNAGNIWLFGGVKPVYPNGELMNDLWKYSTATNEWAWMNGDTVLNKPGFYGQKRVGSPETKPGARSQSATWNDNQGNLYMYAGNGFGSYSKIMLDDIWKYDIALGEWSWFGGNMALKGTAIYGEKGVSSPKNSPGPRSASATWNDTNGNMWMFGGRGYGIGATNGTALNDLWKFSTSSKTWAWMGGSNENIARGFYGIQGTPSVNVRPGARVNASTWTDQGGNFWLFGGNGVGDEGTSGEMNDLWKFSPATSEWTWFTGYNTPFHVGRYGNEGQYSLRFQPGSREGSATWIDSTGSLWLFGGSGYDAEFYSLLNDLWRYDRARGVWAMMKGDYVGRHEASYGIRGVSDPTNHPGARHSSLSWMDKGIFYLFGGYGVDKNYNFSNLNDLWSYDPKTNYWTWIAGSEIGNAPANFGIKGIASPTNYPGGNFSVTSWRDIKGDVWMFGGAVNTNLLWKYSVSEKNWTWMSGDTTSNSFGGYDVKGTSTANGRPSARYAAMATQDASGNVLLYGGRGYLSNAYDYLNDLWMYSPPLLTLPVVLTKFNATRQNEYVTISWSTSSEKNSNYYVIERSSDGINFSGIATIAAQGSSSSLINYSWLDKSPLPGINYYRLRQLDINGTGSYSKIVVVGFQTSAANISLVQNQRGNQISLILSLPEAAELKFEIRSSGGQLLRQTRRSFAGGKSTFTLDYPGAVAGTYFLSVQGKSVNITKRFVH